MADLCKVKLTVLFNEWEDILKEDEEHWSLYVFCLFFLKNWRN